MASLQDPTLQGSTLQGPTIDCTSSQAPVYYALSCQDNAVRLHIARQSQMLIFDFLHGTEYFFSALHRGEDDGGPARDAHYTKEHLRHLLLLWRGGQEGPDPLADEVLQAEVLDLVLKAWASDRDCTVEDIHPDGAIWLRRLTEADAHWAQLKTAEREGAALPRAALRKSPGSE